MSLNLLVMNSIDNILQESSKEHISSLMQKNGESISLKIDGDLRSLQVFAYNYDKYNTDEVINGLKSLYESDESKIYEDILYVDESGVGISLKDKRHYNLHGAKYVEDALNGKALVSKSVLNQYEQEEIVVYASPINSDKKEALVVRVNLEEMIKNLNIDVIENKSCTHIVDENGHIISQFTSHKEHSDSDSIYDIYDLEDVKIFDNDDDVMMVDKSSEQLFLSYKDLPTLDGYYVVTSIYYKDVFNNVQSSISKYTVVVLLQLIIYFAYFAYNINRTNKGMKILETVAYEDELCRICNLRKFKVMSKKAVKNDYINYCVIKLNVRNFKYINGQFGHDVGDDILKFIANILKKNINKNNFEMCARIDNDRFLLLLRYVDDESITKRIKYIEDSINKYIIDKNTTKKIQCSYYVYNLGNKKEIDVDDIVDKLTIFKSVHNDSLINEEDLNILFYDDNIRETMLYNKKLQDDMKLGIENEEFKLYVQPKYNLNTDIISGGEVLIRWQKEEKLIFPDRFIPLFEENRSIIDLDMYIIETACKNMRNWIDQGYKIVPLAINVSKVTLYTYNFSAKVEAIIEKYDIDPSLIEIEITESMDYQNAKLLTDKILRLKNIGVKVSIDDFGSGYSSFNILTDLPIDILKIDKGFLLNNDLNKNNEMIIKSIVDMAKNLNLLVVTEGVETKEHLEFLKDINCDMGQGYLLDRPMKIKEFEKRLSK